MDRRSTNFSLALFEHFKKATWNTEYSFLKYYQEVVRSFIADVDIDARGLLIKHDMGMGKSIEAVAIAIDSMKTRPVVFLAAKSLHDNMRGSVKKYVKMRAEVDPDFVPGRMSSDDLEDWIDANFSFVSMNASNMISQLGRETRDGDASELSELLEAQFGKVAAMPSLRGKLLIVDEAHNLFRAITNGSKNALRLYEVVMNTPDLKVVFFTGTPISNDPFELVPCFNMLGSRTPGKITLPEDYHEFRKLYVDARGHIKNREKFQNRIQGLVSRITHKSRPGIAIGKHEVIGEDQEVHSEYPEELDIIVRRIVMGPNQYTAYSLARDKEKAETGRGRGGPSVSNKAAPSMTKPKSNAASTYRVRSRQLSNFAPPLDWQGDIADLPPESFDEKEAAKYDAMYTDIKPGRLALVYSQFTGIGGLGSFSEFLRRKGWEQWIIIPGEAANNGDIDISETLLDPDAVLGAGETYAETYLERIFAELEYKGGDDKVRKFAVISGDVPHDERAAILRVFWSYENRRGELIAALLISATGAEGLDLKNVRDVLIMEQYWTNARNRQVITRAVRKGSHLDLPVSERNVQPYMYISIAPDYAKARSGEALEPTTEEDLYQAAIDDYVGIQTFNEAIDEVSIECLINGEKNCRACNPNSAVIFTDDPRADIQNPDPCAPLSSIKTVAETLRVGDMEYKYSPDPDSAFGYRIFVHDPIINAYRRMLECHADFAGLVDLINAKK